MVASTLLGLQGNLHDLQGVGARKYEQLGLSPSAWLGYTNPPSGCPVGISSFPYFAEFRNDHERDD
jgi:hypothetical protein